MNKRIYQANIEEVIGFISLYNAARLCTRGVMWKPSVQNFYYYLTDYVSDIYEQLHNGSYKSLGFCHFKLHDRGKIRDINSIHITERMVQKALCIYGLRPAIEPRLIYTNSASQTGKGTHFAIKQLKSDLCEAYRKYGNNAYVLIMDYHAYYDSIRHDILLNMVNNWIEDKQIVNLFAYFLSMFSHIGDPNFTKEIKNIRTVNQFSKEVAKNGVVYVKGYKPDASLKDISIKSGIYIPRLDCNNYLLANISVENGYDYFAESDIHGIGLGLGSEISQIAAVAYISPIDHLIKEKWKIEYYGRYMDDSYIICDDLYKLKEIKSFLIEESAKYGLVYNLNRTNIYKITDHFYFLKKHIQVLNTNKVLMQLSGESITKHRNIMETHRDMFEKDILSFDDCYFSFYSWRESNRYLNSRKLLYQLSCEFYHLFKDEINIYDSKFPQANLRNKLFSI